MLYGIGDEFLSSSCADLCLTQAWLRELGFVVFYGSLIIKLYWIYTQVQSRSAHLRLHIDDRHLLKILFVMILVTVMYLALWTSLYVQLVRI